MSDSDIELERCRCPRDSDADVRALRTAAWQAIVRLGFGYKTWEEFATSVGNAGVPGALKDANEAMNAYAAGIRADVEARLLSGTLAFEGGEMRALTWQEVAEKARAEVTALNAYRSVLSDLSRCEHGRHLGDVCSACGGASVGNKTLTPGMVIGHDISGRSITVPAKAQFATADDWLAALDAEASQ